MRKITTDESLTHNKKIIDFFDSQYQWWSQVYDQSMPKKFFSFEMIKRKQLFVDLLKNELKKGTRLNILECGCGPGGIIKEICHLNCRLTGIDINQRFLEHGRTSIDKKVNWIRSDVENLPFRDGSFDLVYCLGVLSYLKDDEKAIAEMARVTKEDGTVIVSVPNLLMINKFFDPYYYLAWLPTQLCKKLNKHIKKSYETSMIRRYLLIKIVKISKTFNLKLIEIKDVSYGPFTMWRKTVTPLSQSIKISEKIRKISTKRISKTFIYFSNHWIICFSKQSH